MSIKIQCPSCGQVINAPYEMSGAEVQCPTCMTTLLIPIVEAPKEEPNIKPAAIESPTQNSKPASTVQESEAAAPLENFSLDDLIKVLENRYENFYLIRLDDDSINQVLDVINENTGGKELDYSPQTHCGLSHSEEVWNQILQFHVMHQLHKG